MIKNIVYVRSIVLALLFSILIGYGAVKADSLHNFSSDAGIILPHEEELIDLSGIIMRAANVRSYYNGDFGINVTKDKYVVGQYDETSTDYEISQMLYLKEYLNERGINLLYVNEPTKYIDDDVYRLDFGKESYINRNADLFLARLKDAGIEYVDLRDNIIEEGLNSFDFFYRTDHHWTVPASKWAAEIIAGKLNSDFGYDIDLSLYDDNKFNYTEYRECWLGEQGQKLSRTYVGLDDFTLITPAYDTSFSRIIDDKAAEEGDFNLFIGYSMYEDSYDAEGNLTLSRDKSWHYSYNDNGYIQNNNGDYGNVLILGDSYERTLIPFLALGIRNIYKVEPRYMDSGELLDVIDSGNYDTVILTYAQFMIGAHDKPESANYRMFSFFD